MRTSENGPPGNKLCVCARWDRPRVLVLAAAAPSSVRVPLSQGIFGQPKQVGTNVRSLFYWYLGVLLGFGWID